MPIPSVRSSGPITIPVIVGAVTVRVIDPLINPRVAEIELVPAATPVADPPVLIVALAGAEEFQVTSAVRSALLPSSKLPVAVNCSAVFTGSDDDGAETVIETRFGPAPPPLEPETFRLALPWTAPDFAIIVV